MILMQRYTTIKCVYVVTEDERDKIRDIWRAEAPVRFHGIPGLFRLEEADWIGKTSQGEPIVQIKAREFNPHAGGAIGSNDFDLIFPTKGKTK